MGANQSNGPIASTPTKTSNHVAGIIEKKETLIESRGEETSAQDWEPCASDDGRIFYYNIKTSQKTWIHPNDFAKKGEEKAEPKQSHEIRNTIVKDKNEPTLPISTIHENNKKDETTSKIELSTTQIISPPKNNTTPTTKVQKTITPTKEKEKEIKVMEEKKEKEEKKHS